MKRESKGDLIVIIPGVPATSAKQLHHSEEANGDQGSHLRISKPRINPRTHRLQRESRVPDWPHSFLSHPPGAPICGGCERPEAHAEAAAGRRCWLGIAARPPRGKLVYVACLAGAPPPVSPVGAWRGVAACEEY